jgi:predicted nuclease of predicted toxin-antitoxin system
MKLLMDENVSWRIAERLQLDGHTVVLGQNVAAGKPDHEVLALASNIGAVVVTEDNDFGSLVIHQQFASAGVILLRLSDMDRAA